MRKWRSIRSPEQVAQGGSADATSVFALIERFAREHPHHCAVVGLHGSATYGELINRASALASSLHQRKSARVQVVAGLFADDVAHLATLLACLRAGIAYVPLDAEHSAMRNRQIVLHSGAESLLVDAAMGAAAHDLVGPERIVRFANAASARAAPMPPEPPADQPVVVVYTSGSMGAPKGVVHTPASLFSGLKLISFYGVGAQDRVALFAPRNTIASILLSLNCLASGATLLLISEQPSPQSLDLLAAEGGVSVLRGHSGLMRTICAKPDLVAALPDLHLVAMAGDQVSAEEIAFLRARLPTRVRIGIIYGLTEVPRLACWDIPAGFRGETDRMPLGYPIGDEMWLVSDEAGASAEPDAGELVVGGANLASGYWRDEVRTLAAFHPHPHDSQRRVFRTGDIVRLRSDGLLELLGRKDNRVKLRGRIVELEEVEAVARRLEAVAAAGVVPRRNSAGAVESLALYLSGKSEASLPLAGVLPQLRKALLPHAVPTAVYRLARLPRTIGNKLDRVRLAEIDAQVRDREAGAPTRSPEAGLWSDNLERRIAALIAAELQANAVAPTDRFGDLGGDSLEALNAALSLEKVFAVSIDPADLLAQEPLGPIVARIAAEVRSLAAVS
jgi:amino acid adenylation domain-containing protein